MCCANLCCSHAVTSVYFCVSQLRVESGLNFYFCKKSVHLVCNFVHIRFQYVYFHFAVRRGDVSCRGVAITLALGLMCLNLFADRLE